MLKKYFPKYLIDKCQNILQNNGRLLKNVVALFSIKGLEYILGIVTLPYLVITLGTEKFGALAFAQVFAQYFIIITDYGFNFSASKSIAINCNSNDKVKNIFSNVMTVKLMLLLMSAIIYLFLLNIFNFFGYDKILYYSVFIGVIGNALFPLWFFQGIQEMATMTYINILARLISTAMIFIFVKSTSDYSLAGFLQGITPLISAICAIIMILIKYSVIVKPTFGDIKKMLVEGWDVFVSNILISMYTISNTFLLGLVADSITVGRYSAIEKVIKFIIRVLEPISQAIYPHISFLVKNSQEKAILFIKKCLFFICGIMLLTSIMIFIFAKYLSCFLFGYVYYDAVFLIKIMSPLPFIISMSNILGVQTLLTFGLEKLFKRALIKAAFLNTILILPSVYFFGDKGLGVTVVITEIFVVIIMYKYLHNNKINFI